MGKSDIVKSWKIGITSFSVLTLSLLCSSCATPYQKAGFLGKGYTDMSLGSNRYLVTFKGNGFTSPDIVQKYLLRRSAEITINNHRKYFKILGSADDSSYSSYYVPETSRTSGYGSVYGNSFNYDQTETTSGGYSGVVRKPGEKMVIQVYKTKRPNSFNAKKILNSFESK